MQDKTHGLEGSPDKDTQHWFLNDKMLNLERRIAIVEQEIDKLLKESQELQTTVERVLGEWSEK